MTGLLLFFRPLSWFSAFVATAAVPLLPLVRAADDTTGEIDARVEALELAGALSNDGYKIRDGHWSGTFKVGDAPVLAVNLYGGNQYYFSLAATSKAKKIAVTVFDESGKLLAGELISRDTERPLAAAGVSPEASGPYYVRVQLLEGEPAEFCLICTYK